MIMPEEQGGLWYGRYRSRGAREDEGRHRKASFLLLGVKVGKSRITLHQNDLNNIGRSRRFPDGHIFQDPPILEINFAEENTSHAQTKIVNIEDFFLG